MSNPPSTPPSEAAAPSAKEEITLKEKIAFTAGTIPANSAQMYIGQLLTPIYQITLGMNPILLGSLQTIMRLVDAFTDPIFAQLSDNTRSRWGRRKPYVFVGGIITSCIFPFIWTPSLGWDEMTLFLYLLTTIICFQIVHSGFYVPYEAMGMELSTNYNEKTRLFAFRAYLPPILALSAQWLYYFIQTDIFPDPLTGLRIFAFCMGGLMLVTSVLPALWIKERSDNQIIKKDKVPFLESIRMTITCKPFLCILGWQTGRLL